jgi:hypothetical protein
MSIRTGSVMAILSLLSSLAFSAEEAGSIGSGALGSTWADAGKMPDLFSGMWMTYSAARGGGMVESDTTLDVPYTAKAQKFADGYKFRRDIAYAQDGCASPGLPIAMRSGPIKFTYAPGLISIYMQGVGHTRFIRMNQPMGKTSPKYYGNSVGHWEGDTLVVETQDFLPEIAFQYGIGKGLPDDGTSGPIGPGGARGDGSGGPPAGGFTALTKAIWGPHGEGMHMVERMRVVNPDAMELNLTLYDDTVWTKPYVTKTRKYEHIQKGVNAGRAFSGEPEEWVCTVSVTSFDSETNTYKDKDPEEMVKYLDRLGR